MKNINISFRIESCCLFIMIAMVFIALIIRNISLYPFVFADEYYYSKFSRLLPFSNSTIPSYLFLWIYRTTNICGDGFLNCSRIFNTLFFLASSPFIYLCTRRVSTSRIASVITILVLLGPINNYTSYYMPEALYFFSFWLFTWFVLQLDNSSDTAQWCFGGILLGLTSLIKPHALFFLPAIVAYILYVGKKPEGDWMLRAFWNSNIFVASGFSTKLLLGYILAGKAGVTIFGSFYTAVANSAASRLQRYLEILVLSAGSVKAHALAICLIYGMPIAFAINTVFKSVFSKEEIKSDQKISFYGLAVLINLVFVTGIFTGSLAFIDPNEGLRLHMRYYNFALPLLLVVAASQLSLDSTVNTLKSKAAAAAVIGLLIMYAIYMHFDSYKLGFFDSPELRGFTYNPTVFYCLSGISFLALALWVYTARLGAKIFVYFFMPLTVTFSSFYVNQELRQLLGPNVYDKAGIFTKHYLSNEELSKLVIVGSEAGGLFRSLFYLDNPQASLETIPEGSVYDSSKLPAGKEWVLAFGDQTLSNGAFFKLPMNGFTLAHVTDRHDICHKETLAEGIDFSRNSFPDFIRHIDGLSAAEPWGRWSDANISPSVRLEFVSSLPSRFTLVISAQPFGPNAGKVLKILIGNNIYEYLLPNDVFQARIPVDVKKEKVQSIEFIIPEPTSPEQLGMGRSNRKLGVGFKHIGFEE